MPRTPLALCKSAADSMLAFSVEGTHGASFSESLTIDCTGKVRYETTAPFGGSEVGRYETKLAADRLAALKTLARELDAEPERTASLPPQGADTSVTVHGSPEARTWPLRPAASAVHARAAGLQAALIAEARRSPVAALVLSARKTPLTLVITHRGAHAVELVLDEEDIRVRVGQQRFTATSQVGFVDANARGLGGRLRPATFDKGVTGAMLLELADGGAEGYGTETAIEVAGQLRLPGDAEGLPLRVTVPAR